MFARGVASKISSRQVNPSDRPFPTNPSIIKGSEETEKKKEYCSFRNEWMRDWGFGEFKSSIAMVRKEQVDLLGTLDT